MKMIRSMLKLGSIFALLVFTISSAFADTNHDNSPAGKISNLLDEASIKAKMAADPLLNPFDIKVEAKGSTVYLSGQVDTDMQFEKAVSIASSAKGVEDVEAKGLTVKNSNHPLDDLLLTAKVKSALLKDSLVSEDKASLPFTVETKDAVVYIKGEVKNAAIKENALKTVKGVKGVKDVKVDIVVKS